MQDLIEIRGVSKSFGTASVLKDVTVSFAEGAIHGIVGRNGSGKTVLFKCLCGLMPYDTGEIAVRGEVVGRDTEMPRDFGAIIENPGFLPHYSGYKNLKFLADLTGHAGRDDIRKAITLVGLDPDSKKHVRKYSLGMRQRLAIAQAIMESPSLFILDEPLSGLDKRGLAEMRELFLSYRDLGRTMLIASHSTEDIDVLCDTVHEMDEGRLTRVR
ncbi:MAG: ATP-binding cassette domain-containing protein [Coriobacteriaceae bacterium]|jgi:ABC-2 type transport system ATP-binding protein|nr:ATP-binding cassette domain-containing protein [Coriobacteriaceae bacterium]